MVNSIDNNSGFNNWFKSNDAEAAQFKKQEISGINTFSNEAKQSHENRKKENDEIQNQNS